LISKKAKFSGESLREARHCRLSDLKLRRANVSSWKPPSLQVGTGRRRYRWKQAGDRLHLRSELLPKRCLRTGYIFVAVLISNKAIPRRYIQFGGSVWVAVRFEVKVCLPLVSIDTCVSRFPPATTEVSMKRRSPSEFQVT